jgi:hypothetical protein
VGSTGSMDNMNRVPEAPMKRIRQVKASNDGCFFMMCKILSGKILKKDVYGSLRCQTAFAAGMHRMQPAANIGSFVKVLRLLRLFWPAMRPFGRFRAFGTQAQELTGRTEYGYRAALKFDGEIAIGAFDHFFDG